MVPWDLHHQLPAHSEAFTHQCMSTTETAGLQFVLDLMLSQHHNVMLVGGPGVFHTHVFL
jgi:hypothetical protein